MGMCVCLRVVGGVDSGAWAGGVDECMWTGCVCLGVWTGRVSGQKGCTPLAPPPSEMATEAVGTHPTGVHSCRSMDL